LAYSQYALWQQIHHTNQILEQMAATAGSREDGNTGPRLAFRPAGGLGLGKDELRATIREELSVLRAAATVAPAQEQSDEQAQTPVSPASQQAFDSAQRVVRQAIGARVWGDEQAAELMALQQKMNSEQLQAVLAELIPAINDQQVRVVSSGLPF
jgi:hypothetical protein